MKLDITYCVHCGDGYSNWAFEMGRCCGEHLKTRSETDAEEERREEIDRQIMRNANRIKW